MPTAHSHTPLLSPACVSCLVKKFLAAIPKDATREQALDYQRRLGAVLAALPDRTCGPLMMEQFHAAYAEVFGDDPQAEMAAETAYYAAIKRHFNALMADFAAAEGISARIHAANDPLRVALGYAMTGNLIDFGAMDSVEEHQLRTLLTDAPDRVPADSTAYAALRADLSTARRLTFLTDNCGEVVMDKLLIELLRELYPALSITVLVRGAPVLNDATMEDARQIGLDAIPGVSVMGNGDGIAGTVPERLSPDALAAVMNADLIIAKGQGNYETLQGCGLRIYYVFLCKCQFFADRFSVPLLTGMLVGEQDARGRQG